MTRLPFKRLFLSTPLEKLAMSIPLPKHNNSFEKNIPAIEAVCIQIKSKWDIRIFENSLGALVEIYPLLRSQISPAGNALMILKEAPLRWRWLNSPEAQSQDSHTIDVAKILSEFQVDARARKPWEALIVTHSSSEFSIYLASDAKIADAAKLHAALSLLSEIYKGHGPSSTQRESLAEEKLGALKAAAWDLHAQTPVRDLVCTAASFPLQKNAEPTWQSIPLRLNFQAWVQLKQLGLSMGMPLFTLGAVLLRAALARLGTENQWPIVTKVPGQLPRTLAGSQAGGWQVLQIPYQELDSFQTLLTFAQQTGWHAMPPPKLTPWPSGHWVGVGILPACPSDLEIQVLSTDAGPCDLFWLCPEGASEGYLSWRLGIWHKELLAALGPLLQTLCAQFAENPELLVSHANLQGIISPHWKKWNANSINLPLAQTIPQLFAPMLVRSAGKILIKSQAGTLSFGELDRRSRQLAMLLRKSGIRPGDLVGIALHRSPDILIVLLGILRAGAGYVPLDLSFPTDRLRFMLEDAKAAACICEPGHEDLLPPCSKPLLWNQLKACLNEYLPQEWTDPKQDPRSIAYVIYTSGSTGQPKGVMLSHHSVVNFLLAMQRSPALEASDHVLAVTTLSFDIAVLELLLPILCDSSFYLASAEESLDGATLCQLIQSEAITTMQATPSKFRLMLNAGWQKSSLRKVLCGGEAFPIDVAKRILPLVDELWNMYGPTETTVWSTIHRIEKVDGFIPIGRPIANTGVYILDSLMNPVLPGEKGNLWIGGDGLALGYLHRPELSAEKFRDIQSINERAYNTGDIGRYNWDGILEIFGRSDHQVKLRGYRIELGEIEAAIASFPGISQCLAAVQEFGIDDFRLVAYVCCIAQFDERSLRKAAKDRLPSFMLPAHYMKLDALPLLPNGKIDRKGLPHPLKVAALQPPKAADKINFSQPEVETKNKTLPKIPVTPSQARMLFIEEMDPQTTVHNLVSAWTVQGNLDLAAFKIALEAVIARQEALRMAVAIEESESTLKIFPPFRPYLEIIPNIYKDQKIDAEQNTILEIAHEHIDVSKTPNFRAILIQRSSSEFIFALVTHHIFWDGFSYGIFWKNIQTCYLQALSSKTSTPTNLEINFSQYAIQRQHDLNQPQFIEEMAYWHKTLTPLPEPLELAYDFLRPAELQHKAATAWIPWDKNLDRKLEIFTRAQNCTPFHALLAAYYVLLHRLTGQLDLVIGTPVHGRTQVEHFDIIGNFINVVALRQAFDPKTNFNSLVDQVKRITTEAMAHSELPFEKIVAELKLPRDAARTPLYNTMLFFQDFSLQKIQLGNLQVEGLRLPSINVDTDFVLWVERFTHGTFAGINFRTDLWERESIVSIAGGFRTLLESLLDRPTRNLSDATILTAAEVAKQGVPPQKPLNIDKTTLVTLLLAQAKINSHRPAIIDLHGKHMTWLELEAKSLSLALSLQKIAVKPGDIVGVCLSRSPDLIVVLLAILRAGAAYLPLDPQYPRDRLNYMISDSGAKLILTESTYLDQLQGNTTEIKCLDRDALLFNHEAKQGYILQAPLPEDLAYLIYTSGSTGLPKAVEIQHAAVVTFLKGFQTAVALPKNMRTLALTTISFDISVLEIFGTLAWGGTIILVGQDQSNEAMPIISALKEHDINLLQATPATYHLLLAAGWQGHPDLTLLCGGEALTKNLARSLLARSKALWNVYGPTEATVWAVAAKIVDSEKPITIGKVLPGYEAYILDEQRRPIPQGTIGTLFLGGSALALAYRHRPDLTEERFIAHPLRPESKIYDTGDLCRFRSDGTIEYISRKDNQIKLRGYRIELGEIEAAIAKHPQVTQAVVVVKKDQEDDHRLIAYCTIKAGSNLSFADLLAVLRPQLPGYMLHNKLVVLDQFKLTGSGKVDKKQLPHPSDEGLVKSEIIPKVGIETKLTPEEQSLATIWREMIGVQRVDRLDNFFDLGGHSLLALKVLHRCHQDLGAKFKVRDLLMLNLAQLAHQLPASTSGSSSGKKGGL